MTANLVRGGFNENHVIQRKCHVLVPIRTDMLGNENRMCVKHTARILNRMVITVSFRGCLSWHSYAKENANETIVISAI